MPPRAKHAPINASAVDLFCGAGGLTRGLLNAGIPVVAGYDTDEACRYAYEYNNSPAAFIRKSVARLRRAELKKHYTRGRVRILVGCAPCTTFSRYAQGSHQPDDPRWLLLKHFARLVKAVKPHIVSIENVPELLSHKVFADFLETLRAEKFHFSADADKLVVHSPDYGVPQSRSRLVLLASRLGPIELLPRTHAPSKHRTVADALRGLPSLAAGEISSRDSLHRASALSTRNIRRIRQSEPGGSWREWPADLIAKCHRKSSGTSFGSVYGRMEWDRPAPTITTQFYGFGNGRFGHPEQDRALSLREGAILQSFPRSYRFFEPDTSYSVKTVGRMIGNAVPVRLGEIIGRSIKAHLTDHGK